VVKQVDTDRDVLEVFELGMTVFQVESDSRLSFGTLPTPSPASNVTKLTQLNIHDNLARIWRSDYFLWAVEDRLYLRHTASVRSC